MLSIAAGPGLVGRRGLPGFGAAAGDGVPRILCRSLHLHKAGSRSTVIQTVIGVDPPRRVRAVPGFWCIRAGSVGVLLIAEFGLTLRFRRWRTSRQQGARKPVSADLPGAIP